MSQLSRRIHIKKSTNTLGLYQNGTMEREYPVATGKSPALTPEGTFSVVFKTTCPGWTNPQTQAFIAGCTPSNPLGTRWIGLGVGETKGRTYGIHGTNRPESIGSYISLGCVRMQNQDVEELYPLIHLGTMVTIEP